MVIKTGVSGVRSSWESTARNWSFAAAAAKDQFLAVLSHELRTPLTPVLMTIHALRRKKTVPDELRDSLDIIERNVKLEVRFIDDLLDVTRISLGKLEIEREPLDFH